MWKNVVLVDYGGVLSDDHLEPASSKLANVLGLDLNECKAVLSESSQLGRSFRMGELTEAEFWDAVWESTGPKPNTRPQDVELTRLWAQTYRLNPEVLAILERVRQQSLVGILTNIDQGRSRYLVEVVGVLEMVDFYFPTYRFGAVKPDGRLFTLIDHEVLKREPRARTIYVDDRESHVEAARRHGWTAFQFRGVTDFDSQLCELGVLYNGIRGL